MVELVHDQRQIYTLQTGMIPPGLSQTVGAEVSSQTNLLADGSDELSGLSTTNGFSEIIVLRIEEQKMLWIAGDVGVSRKILLENLPDTCIDKNLMAFALFLLFDLETVFEALSIIHEMTDLQSQEIRNTQSGVDPRCE